MTTFKNFLYKTLGISGKVAGINSVSWDDLTIQFSDATKVYEDWTWLLGDKIIRPLMVTKFGDLFYQRDSGQVYFLDTLEGTDIYISNSNEDFKTFIYKKENIEHYLMSYLVHELINQGKVTASHQCYSFELPPVLGGEVCAENVEIIDAVVSISIIGQIHRKIKDLPEGTAIKRFSITD